MKKLYYGIAFISACISVFLYFHLNINSHMKFLVLVSVFMGICLSVTPVFFIPDEKEKGRTYKCPCMLSENEDIQ